MLQNILGTLADWEARDLTRFVSGEWIAPNFGRDLAAIPGHYAHVSIENGAQIAYTQSADKGARDIQTRTRPGRYLAKFYPELTAPEVSDLAAAFGANHSPEELKLATSPEDIGRVYAVGPNSCMKGDSSPEVYGAGDLAIAYLGDLAGQVTARAICWPAKSIFGYTYGDSIRLRSALESKGYSHADRCDWYGARLLRRRVGDYRFVCPYLDMAEYVEDSGEFLVISSDGMGARNTCGEVGDMPYSCAACYTGLSEDEIFTADCSDSTYCESCFGERFSYCECCESEQDSDDFTNINVNVRGGRAKKYVCDSCASDLAECPDCRGGADRYESDYTCAIAGETYCERHAKDHSECETCAYSADSGRMVGDCKLCDDCATAAENVRDCAECGEGFAPPIGREHLRYCADCGAGEIAVARGAIARPTWPAPAWRGAEVATEVCDGGRSFRYVRGDIFAAQMRDGRHVLGFATSCDVAGFVRAFYAFGFGAYCAPFGRRPTGNGARLASLCPARSGAILRGEARGRYYTFQRDAADAIRDALL